MQFSAAEPSHADIMPKPQSPHEFQAVEQAITRKCNGVSISTSNLHNAHILQVCFWILL